MRTIAVLFFAVAFTAAPIVHTVTHADGQDDSKKKKKSGPKVSVMGKVSCVKKDTDDYTSIKLTAQDGTVYNITIDDKGKDLAKMYEGISVVANGTVAEKDNEKWLTVTSTGDKKKGKK